MKKIESTSLKTWAMAAATLSALVGASTSHAAPAFVVYDLNLSHTNQVPRNFQIYAQATSAPCIQLQSADVTSDAVAVANSDMIGLMQFAPPTAPAPGPLHFTASGSGLCGDGIEQEGDVDVLPEDDVTPPVLSDDAQLVAVTESRSDWNPLNPVASIVTYTVKLPAVQEDVGVAVWRVFQSDSATNYVDVLNTDDETLDLSDIYPSKIQAIDHAGNASNTVQVEDVSEEEGGCSSGSHAQVMLLALAGLFAKRRRGRR